MYHCDIHKEVFAELEQPSSQQDLKVQVLIKDPDECGFYYLVVNSPDLLLDC